MLKSDASAPPRDKAPARPGWDVAVRALVILGAAIWIYWPALLGDWLWDDTQLIQANALVHDPAGWWKIWLQPGRMIDFQPITTTFFWGEWHLFGNNTLGYHVINVLLHVVCSLLVWRLFARLGLQAAWLGGLLFAVHPLMVESVAWIAEAKNVLSLPPFLLAMLAWIDFGERRDAHDYWRSLALFLVALLCKATVVMFPVLILLYAWYRRGRISRDDLRGSAPFFLLSLAIGILTLWFLHRHATDQPELPDLGGPLGRITNSASILGFYLTKSLWPQGLLPVYPQWAVNPYFVGPCFLWALLGLAAFWPEKPQRPWRRHLMLGLGFFIINLLPFLGFTAGSYMAFTWVMDHVVYVPIIGLAGLVVAGWGEMERRLGVTAHRILVGATAVVITVMAWGSHAYARVFTNSETLWGYTLKENPDSWIAYANLGQAHRHMGRRDVALSDYAVAARLRPHDANLRCNVGGIFDELGKTREAIEQYDLALAIDPRSVTAFCNRGVALTQIGRLSDALVDYRRALEIKPDYPEAHCDLGVALSGLNRPLDAINEYRAALALSPEYMVAHANLGDALGEMGHFTEALAEYRKVLELNPGDASAHYNCGVALIQLQRLDEAAVEFRAALRIDPRYPRARNSLRQLGGK